MSPEKRNLTEIHIAALLFGFVPIFPKVIALPATLIILGRCFVASCTLFGVLKINSQSIAVRNKKDLLSLIILGVSVAAHWVLYFYATQVSTVAVGKIAIFTYPLMTVFLEPIFFSEKLRRPDIFSAVLLLIGILFVIPDFSLQNSITLGILCGLLSALIFSFRNIYSKKFLKKYPSTVIMWYQVSIATIALLPFWYLNPIMPSMREIVLIALLGTVFTAGAHTFYIKSLTHLRATTVAITEGLSVLYSIILGILLLSEIPDTQTLIGGSLVVLAVMYQHVTGNKIHHSLRHS